MAKNPLPQGARSVSWPRLLGEFFVIVFGVLVALAADSCNDARLDRINEREYLARLHTAVVADTANFRFMLSWMDRKETGLGRLDALLSTGSRDFDPDTVLADLSAAPIFGWNSGPLTNRATFEDLRSSGRLGLIRDQDLRSQVVQYYFEAETEDRRIEARKTQYPLTSYQLVPFGRSGSGPDEFAQTQDVGALLATLGQSELPRHIQAELNRALFIQGSVTGLRQLAQELLDAIGQELRTGG